MSEKTVNDTPQTGQIDAELWHEDWIPNDAKDPVQEFIEGVWCQVKTKHVEGHLFHAIMKRNVKFRTPVKIDPRVSLIYNLGLAIRKLENELMGLAGQAKKPGS